MLRPVVLGNAGTNFNALIAKEMDISNARRNSKLHPQHTQSTKPCPSDDAWKDRKPTLKARGRLRIRGR
jgi:hypothetical protein